MSDISKAAAYIHFFPLKQYTKSSNDCIFCLKACICIIPYPLFFECVVHCVRGTVPLSAVSPGKKSNTPRSWGVRRELKSESETVCTLREGSEYLHCNENPIYVLPEKELRGLRPNFPIHVSVSDFYTPRIYFPAAE
jgi:hypothetical protein